MNIPEQLKPLSQKGDKFVEDTALAIASMARGSYQNRKNDEFCWDLFNGKIDPKKFDYLTKIGEFSLPSKARHVSIQRPPCNLLISQQSRRPFVSSVKVADNDSIEEKFKNKFTAMIKRVEMKIQTHKMAFEVQYKQLLQKEEQIKEMLNQEPQNQEQAEQIMQLRQQLPAIETQIQTLKDEFQRRIILSDDEIRKVREYLDYEYKEVKELLAQKGMIYIRNFYNLQRKRVNYFQDKIVTGKGYYYVDFIDGSDQLIFDNIDSMQLSFPSIPGIEFVEDGPWVMIEDWISYSQVIDEYGGSKKLNEKALKKLDYYKDFSPSNNVGRQNANVYSGNVVHGQGISRKRIWWKSPRYGYVKLSPNKHKKGTYFRHFIDDDKVHEVKPKNGEKYEKYYINDVFCATVIANDIVIEGGRIEKPLRRMDNYSTVELPVVGRAHSSHHDEPYSLIWNTKDIQELYNIVNIHREYYLAASGVKGQVVDLSQKPGTMSVEEWRMHKKTGNLYIETRDKAGRKMDTHFNQWTDYDDTVSPAIQFLEGIMLSLKDACKETMGVTRQRMGQTVNADQVGTSEMARDQSALITEILYYESDYVEARALRRALNLMAQKKWKDGALFQITNPDLTSEIVKIPKNLLNVSEYDIHVLNNSDQERDMMEIKQLSLQNMGKNGLEFRNIIEMYNIDSLVELKSKVIRWTEEAKELAQKAQENEQEAAMQAEQMKINMEKEFEAMMAREKNELEKVKLEIEQVKLRNEQENDRVTAMLKEKDILSRKEIEYLKLLTNNEVNMENTAEQTRNNQMKEELEAIGLRLNHLQEQVKAALKNREIDIKEKEIESKERIQKSKDSQPQTQ